MVQSPGPDQVWLPPAKGAGTNSNTGLLSADHVTEPGAIDLNTSEWPDWFREVHPASMFPAR